LICAPDWCRLRAVAMPPHTDQAKWFAEEVQPHEPQLRGYLRGSFPAVRDVDDVVQESYLRVWRARASHPIDSARAFLFTVARRLALRTAMRSRALPAVAMDEAAALQVPDASADPAAALDYREKVVLLAEALRHLPPRCREIVIRRKLLGLSQKIVAAQLGLSERTVENQLARGIRRCEDRLRRRGVENCFDR
jgi:RNA polymerase sigma-70 factor (ECF subfamily)